MAVINQISLPNGDTHETYDVQSKYNSIYYGICSTAQGTKEKIVSLVNGSGFTLREGTVLCVSFANASATSTMTMVIKDGDTVVAEAKNLYQSGTSVMGSGTTTNGWVAGAMVIFVYSGTGWVRAYWANTTYSVNWLYSGTASGTAAKAAGGYSYPDQPCYFPFYNTYANTAKSALTLRMIGSTYKPIYLNGEISSSTNYTFPAGIYVGYYDGTNYYFRTDGKIPKLHEIVNEPEGSTLNFYCGTATALID